MTTVWPHRQTAATAVLTLALIKLAALAVVGPLRLPDTGGYERYATTILAAPSSLISIDLTKDAMPVEAFRMAGYPLVIAAAELLFTSHYAVAVVIAQIFASVYATYRFWWLLERIGLPPWLSATAVFCQATALIFWIDQALLSDSLYCSLVTVAITLVLGAALERTTAPAPWLGAGLLLALAFLLREASLVLFPLLIPVVVLGARLATDRPWRGGLIVASTFLPFAITAVTYAQWNEIRSGHRFITSTAHINMLLPLIEAQRYDAGIFGGDSALDRIVRPNLKTYDLLDTMPAVEAWHKQSGIDTLAAAADTTARYRVAWLQHPVAMLRAFTDRVRLNFVFLTCSPFATLDDLIILVQGTRQHWTTDAAFWIGVRSGALWQVVPLALVLATKAVALVITLGFLGFPWLARAHRLPAGFRPVLVALWGAALAWGLLHALLHVEPRHLMPMLPVAILLGISTLATRVAETERREGWTSLTGRTPSEP